MPEAAASLCKPRAQVAALKAWEDSDGRCAQSWLSLHMAESVGEAFEVAS